MKEKLEIKLDLDFINSIIYDKGEYEKRHKLNLMLCQQPPEEWVEDSPYYTKDIRNAEGKIIKVPTKYIPIDKIEYLLRAIFKTFKIEVKKIKQTQSIVQVSVRVHYKDVITGDWLFHDGVASESLYNQKYNTPLDKGRNKSISSSASSIAKSEAFKNACKHFGDLFGANLNRDRVVIVKPIEQEKDILLKRLKDLILQKVNLINGDLKIALDKALQSKNPIVIKRAIEAMELL